MSVPNYSSILDAMANQEWSESSCINAFRIVQVKGQTIKLFRNGRTETTSNTDAKLLSSRTIVKE